MKIITMIAGVKYIVEMIAKETAIEFFGGAAKALGLKVEEM